MKKIYMFGLKAFVLIMLIIVVLAKCHSILMSKSQNGRISAFYNEEKNSLEAVFIGSSHIFMTAYPFQLWEDYGIKSTVLGMNGMGIPVEYYCVKEAIREQHPDVIVVDLYKAYSNESLESISHTHNLFDAMPYSMNRWDMLSTLVPEENKVEFYFPLYLYHVRWKELTQTDFEERVTYAKGASPQFGIYDASAFVEVPSEEKQEVPEMALMYIEKIIDECAENNVELIFTVIPYETTEETEYHQRIFNMLEDELADRNVEYYNFFHMMEDVGIDVQTDFYNKGHLNYDGGTKVTAYLGEILSEKGLGNKQDNDEKWQSGAKLWHSYVQSEKIKLIKDKYEYIDFINKSNYEFIFMIKNCTTFVDLLREKGLIGDEVLIENKSIYIYDDGVERIYPVDGQEIEFEFNGSWIQSVEDTAVMVDKKSYEFTKDIKIFVYDIDLKNIIDIVEISEKKENVIR